MSLAPSLGGFAGDGFAGGGFAPDVAPAEVRPAEPIILESELAGWLHDRTGRPVYTGVRDEGQAALPAITLATVDGDSIYHLTGPSGLCWSLVQFDAWANDLDAAAKLQAAIFASLAGYRGWVGRAFVDSAMAGRRMAGWFDADDASSGQYRVMREYRLWWNETTA